MQEPHGGGQTWAPSWLSEEMVKWGAMWNVINMKPIPGREWGGTRK